MVDVANLCMGCMEQKGSDTVCPACGFKEGSEPESPLHLRPRTELHGQYLVGKVLGHGGFGITYLGWDLNLERKIAIKEYLPSGVAVRTGINSEVVPFSGETRKDFEYGLERYLDEARTVARFQMHPSVVSVLNFFRANGTAYLVMEYLEGATFERYLESNGGKTNIDTVMTVMIPVLEALASVHSQGILHRDISPDNVYITRKWQVKVLDFGAARYALGQKSRNLSVILKEGYAPVEQYHSKGNQGPWTDAYACAATIYRALTGKIPPSSLDRLQSDDMEAPSAQGVEIGEVQERAILKALAVHPDKRFKTMQEFKDALTGVAPADVIEQTGEKLKSQSLPPVSPVPVVTGPKQVQTVKSGTPEPQQLSSEQQPISQREAAHSRRQQTAKMPKWVWAAAAGMLLAVGGIGGYKSYQDHEREVALKQQQERARILQEEELKRQQALAAEMEKRRQERESENARLRQQQEELDRKNRELEQKERELQDLKAKNVRVPSNNQSKNQQQQQQQQQNYYAQLLEAQRKEREKLDEERRQLAERYQQTRLNRNQTQQNQTQIPTPTPAPTPTPVLVPPQGAGYENLMQQAANLSRARNYQSALQLNRQAIQMNPARPDAYSNIGWISLYATGDLQTALSSYKDAIAHGGTAWFRVLHDHQQMSYQDHCQGDLGISRDGVTYRAQDGIHNFVVGKSAVREIKENKTSPLSIIRKVKDDFHIKTTDDRNFNMLPVSNARQVRDMILQLAK